MKKKNLFEYMQTENNLVTSPKFFLPPHGLATVCSLKEALRLTLGLIPLFEDYPAYTNYLSLSPLLSIFMSLPDRDMIDGPDITPQLFRYSVQCGNRF